MSKKLKELSIYGGTSLGWLEDAEEVEKEITMATITEDYVSFEVAKLLKEKGFDEPCQFLYFSKYKQEGDFLGNFNTRKNSEINELSYSAPTLQMTMKWLRKVHHIDISIIPLRTHKEYLPRIESDTISYDAIPCKEYEDACETAIKYCLKNLI